MLGAMMDKLQAVASGQDTASGVPTGFCDLDKMTLGLHPSDFIIIAGRPSMGKTAFSLNLVQNVALYSHKSTNRKPYVVAFFSLEMSKEQLLHRMLCAEARIDSQALRTGKLEEKEWERLWGVCDMVNGAKIAIDDTPAITPLELRSKARKIKSEQGLDLIVIDYLQLMQGSGKHSNSDNRQQEVSEISRSLKALARELKVPVIALSQLSRGVEARQVKRPMLSDLRESGSLEQDADIVAFLYRDDYYNPQTDKPNITELIIAKHRNGSIGTVELYFHKEYTRFDSFTTEF
jgi:replicative DNA helicase